MHGYKPIDTPLPGGWRKEDATSGEEVDATVYRQLVGSLMYLGVYFSSTMKVWIIWANLVGLSLGYKSNRSPMESERKLKNPWTRIRMKNRG